MILSLCVPLLVTACLAVWRIEWSEAHADLYQVLGSVEGDWASFLASFWTTDGLYGGFHPPLYFSIARLFGEIFEATDLSFRYLSVVALLLLVVLTWAVYPLILEPTSPLWRGWWSLAVGISPPHIWWAQTAKYTMWLYLFYAVSMALGLWFIRERRLRSAILYAVALTATLYTHYLALFWITAHFITIGTVSVLDGDRRFRRLVTISSLLVAVLTAPVATVLFRAALERDEEGYHDRFHESMGPADIMHGVFVNWNLGYTVVPIGGTTRTIEEFRAADWGERAGLGLALVKLSSLILGMGVFLAAAWFATIKTARSTPDRLLALFVTITPAVAIALSATRGMSGRFMYLGFGTWCTMTFFAIGFQCARKAGLPIFLAVSVLFVQGLSLSRYFSNLELKYPGARLVVSHLLRSTHSFDLAVIDDWIVVERGSAIDKRLDGLPRIILLSAVDTHSFAGLRQGEESRTVAFLAGDPLLAELKLSELRTLGPRWIEVAVWESLETRGRSIRAYEPRHTEPW
jgi:uncharacterized membrane protein